MLTESFLQFFERLGAEWVLWLLVVLAFLAVVVMVERFLYFRRNRVDAAKLSSDVVAALRSGGAPAARKVLEGVPGMTGNVLHAAMDAYDDGVDSVEEVILAAIAQQRVNYDRFLPILGTLGNTAPFVGLFGTVIGILVAFSALGSGAEGNLLKEQVMGSIGEALVATAVGLGVAIPCVIAFNAFKNRVRIMAGNTEGVARTLLAYLKATGPNGGRDGGR